MVESLCFYTIENNDGQTTVSKRLSALPIDLAVHP